MQSALTCGNAAGTVSTLGGELVSYRDAEGTEYVWTGDASYWTGHAPVLFPIVGALKGGTVSIGGSEFQMPKHGIARKREFVLAEQTEDSVTFELKSNDQTRPLFPHDFCLRITQKISNHGFSTEYDVFCPEGDSFDFCIGGHAGFCCPLHPGEAFSDYVLEFEQEERPDPCYTDSEGVLHRGQRRQVPMQGNVLPLDYGMFDDDVLIFDEIRSRSVKLVHRTTGKGIRFEFNGFSSLGIWTPPGKQAPFLCLEPWQGLPAYSDEDGAFEHKPGLLRCDSGAHVRRGYQVTIL